MAFIPDFVAIARKKYEDQYDILSYDNISQGLYESPFLQSIRLQNPEVSKKSKKKPEALTKIHEPASNSDRKIILYDSYLKKTKLSLKTNNRPPFMHFCSVHQKYHFFPLNDCNIIYVGLTGSKKEISINIFLAQFLYRIDKCQDLLISYGIDPEIAYLCTYTGYQYKYFLKKNIITELIKKNINLAVAYEIYDIICIFKYFK
jgi:hypothetical protein